MEIPRIQPKIPNLSENVEIQKPETNAEPVGFVKDDSAGPSAPNNFDEVLTGATSGRKPQVHRSPLSTRIF